MRQLFDASMSRFHRNGSANRETQQQGNTLGGVIRCVARGVPAGLGEPVFEKLDAVLAAALMSTACKGVEVGSGFSGTQMTGLEHNDPFIPDGTGHHDANQSFGRYSGGISNGSPILAAAFKPVSTVFHAQDTVNEHGEPVSIRAKGRHDPETPTSRSQLSDGVSHAG